MFSRRRPRRRSRTGRATGPALQHLAAALVETAAEASSSAVEPGSARLGLHADPLPYWRTGFSARDAITASNCSDAFRRDLSSSRFQYRSTNCCATAALPCARAAYCIAPKT